MTIPLQVGFLEWEVICERYVRSHLSPGCMESDMSIFPWYGGVVLGNLYSGSKEFLNIEEEYPNVVRWTKEIAERPAVKRGMIVNKSWGDGPRLPERHSRSDFDQLDMEASA